MHVQTDPLRKFYTSLLAQRPDSELAMKWWGRTGVSFLGWRRGSHCLSSHFHSQLDECVNYAFPSPRCVMYGTLSEQEAAAVQKRLGKAASR